MEIIRQGGFWMWPIVIISLVSLGLIFERVFVLWFKYRLDSQSFLQQIIGYVEEKNFSRAIEICNVEGGHPLARVLKSGLLKANENDKEIQRSMEAETLNILPEVTKRVGYLSMLANVATLMGLLGTIMGLIECFESVGSASDDEKNKVLSNGISKAMLTTAGGLVAAIPSMIAFSILQNRQNDLLSSIEAKASELFNFLSARNHRLRRG